MTKQKLKSVCNFTRVALEHSEMSRMWDYGREYCLWHDETCSVCCLSCPCLSSINVHHTVIRQSQQNIESRRTCTRDPSTQTTSGGGGEAQRGAVLRTTNEMGEGII